MSWTRDNLTDDGSARSTLFGINVEGSGDFADLLGEVALAVEVLEDTSVCVRIAFAAVKGIWERYSAVTYGIPTMCSELCRTLLDAAVQLKRATTAYDDGPFRRGFEAQIKDVEETVDRIMGYAKEKSYLGRIKFFILSKSLHEQATEKAERLVEKVQEMDRDTQLKSSIQGIRERVSHTQRRVDLHEQFGAEGEDLVSEERARTEFKRSLSEGQRRIEAKIDAQDARKEDRDHRAREAAMLRAQALRLQARAEEVQFGVS